MSLWIADSDASDDRIQAGVSEALAVLNRSGVTAQAAHDAMMAMLEGEDSFDRDAADAWESAETAAFRVAFAGRERWPEAAMLVIRH